MKRVRVAALLAVPGVVMATMLGSGSLAMDLLDPSGELAVALLVLALLPGPLAQAFGLTGFLRGWLGIRRELGLAAFGYGLLHLLFYALDAGMLAGILSDLALPSMWTGWLALALLVAPAAISSDRATRALGRRWKRVQRMVYPALALALAHWLLLDWHWQLPAMAFLPLGVAWLLRLRQTFPKGRTA